MLGGEVWFILTHTHFWMVYSEWLANLWWPRMFWLTLIPQHHLVWILVFVSWASSFQFLKLLQNGELKMTSSKLDQVKIAYWSYWSQRVFPKGYRRFQKYCTFPHWDRESEMKAVGLGGGLPARRWKVRGHSIFWKENMEELPVNNRDLIGFNGDLIINNHQNL